MQYGNVDVTLDIIRGIDAMRRGACALWWGIRESGCICVLMPKIETDILRLSHIRDIYLSWMPDELWPRTPIFGSFGINAKEPMQL